MSTAHEFPQSLEQDQQTQVEYVQDDQRKRIEWKRSEAIEELINKCARALEYGQRKHLRWVAKKLKEELIPLLLHGVRLVPADIEAELADHKYWHPGDFYDFLDMPEKFLDDLRERPSEITRSLTTQRYDIGPNQTEAAETVKRAFLSCAAIAEQQTHISSELTEKGDAIGFASKLGVHRQHPEHDFGDRVDGVTDDLGALKSFYTGGTGSGKSVGASAQMWDYYSANFRSGESFKCFDPIGMSVGENVNCYDVGQYRSELRERREKFGLTPSIGEGSLPVPQTELYLPLTPDLESEQLPYDEDNEEFVSKPFTVAASDLSPGLLTSMIDTYISQDKIRTIRDVHNTVDRQQADWSLADLADEIRSRAELSQKHTKDALRALRALQSLGFIRTKHCGHDHDACREGACRFHLDMDAIMSDTETITRVTQSKMRTEFGQLVVIAFLLDRIWYLRRLEYDYDMMVIWLRELWEIAPHGNARNDYPDREEAILEHIVTRLKKMLRKPRDIGTHLLSDTQEPNDCEKGVRRRFNRYVVYSANDETLSNIFEWVGKDGKDVFKSTLSDEPGQGGIIGGCAPAIGSSRVWGMSPVEFTPPPWYHHDKDNDGNGWKKRVELRENEEFRNHGWPTAMPDELEISIESRDEERESVDPSEIDRETRIEIAQNLRNDGMTVREIGDKVNRGRTWVSNHTEDPAALG